MIDGALVVGQGLALQRVRSLIMLKVNIRSWPWKEARGLRKVVHSDSHQEEAAHLLAIYPHIGLRPSRAVHFALSLPV